ncbi:unnamed protein product [Urochloa decumbens]|uniref:Uncharacterized protein n=1 Tax=Urochloa decumbens TaxID=240449 RepID=A0ABC9CT02_9POAL
MVFGRVPPRREEPPGREHAEEPRRRDGTAIERPVIRHEEALGGGIAVHLVGCAARRHHSRREGAVLDQLRHPPLLLPLLASAVHPRGEVRAHCFKALLHDVHGRAHQRVARGAEAGELGEASHGVRERGDGVVADVELPERDEEADAVGEVPQVLEVLAHVEGLQVAQVLEPVGELAEAVEARVQRPERHHVGGGGWQVGDLVGVDGEAPEPVELEPQRVRKLRQLVEVGVQLLQCSVCHAGKTS